MIEIKNKSDCCGCSSCANACLKHSITMVADEEGFQYPQIDTDRCVKCNICEHVCPVLSPVVEQRIEQAAYLVQHKDDTVRLDSSAGGAFTAIAANILHKSGVVFGAAYNEQFRVHHIFVENEAELKRFRNSKYVQSDLGNCFQQVKTFLKENRWVCFSGTPCQIEGLAKYLGKRYERLVLIDVVCHGIPSPLIWNKYLEYQCAREENLDNIRFRDKYYGYKYSTMSLIRNGKNVYHAGAQLDPMLRAFFSDICDRPSCYECPFKKRYRVSDLTIWDCFSVYDFDKTMDDDKGTTRVLCHTEKGVAIIQEISGVAKCKEVPAYKLVSGVKEMYESVEMNPKRAQFFMDAQKMMGLELFKKYYPITAKTKIKTAVRKALLLTGVYGAMKRCLNKVRGR